MTMHCAPTCQTCHVIPAQTGTTPVRLNTKENSKIVESASSFTSIPETQTIITHGPEVATKDLWKMEWGQTQRVEDDHREETLMVIEHMKRYMVQQVMIQDKFVSVRGTCRNVHEQCSFWAALGECENNPSYMKTKCAPSCQSCEMLLYEHRCPIDPNAPVAWLPGDLNKMFERITAGTSEFAKYIPTILSSPETTHGPWVVMLDNFLSEEECDLLIYYGHAQGYDVSYTVGRQLPDGSRERVKYFNRTSTNAWCQGTCFEDPAVQQVFDRLEWLTGIPRNHSEQLQLLKYEPNQFYTKHHDYLDHHLNQPQSVRILTVFFYLNDVLSGGETQFPSLNLSVVPKRGRAVLWPSVLNEDPVAKDVRTEHEALAVKEGIKYGANAWVHQRDYATPHRTGCII